jgi:4-hydroxybenzoyl-CoA reductase subunit alpha
VNTIGSRTIMKGSLEKVTGAAKYTDDIKVKNPLYIKLLRSPHAFAKIVSINLDRVIALEGVKCVVTGADFKNTFGVLPISKDEPALARDVVRYVGEPVVAVAAETIGLAKRALDLIDIKYIEKRAHLNPSHSLRKSEDRIHPELPNRENNLHKHVEQSFGDLENGFENSDTIVSSEFTFPSVTHAFTEPHCTVVEISGDKELKIYSATQVPHYVHRAVSEVLEVPMHKVRVIKPYLGGGFGGKSDPFPHEMVAAKVALLTGRNTKITFSREEVFFSHHGRHPSKIKMKLGVSKDDGLKSLEGNILIDGGAYGSFGVVTSYYNGVLLQGPYNLPNFSFNCDRVYTNKPMCGAMRGHGGVNPRFAMEVLLDEACTNLGVDPCEFRLGHFLKPYSLTPNEFRITSVSVNSGLKKAMAKSKWSEKYGKLPFGKGIGVGCGFFISGSNLPIHWNQMPQSSVRLTIDFDGGVTLYSGASDIGQGSDTMLAMMASEVLGLPMDMIKVVSADTRLCPIDLGSYSSRVTFMAGNAARNAAIRVRKILAKAAYEMLELKAPKEKDANVDIDFFKQGQNPPKYDSPYLGANPKIDDGLTFSDQKISEAQAGESVDYIDVVRRALDFGGALNVQGVYSSPKLGGTFKGAGAGLSPAYSMSVFISEVDVNPSTGAVKVEKVTCFHDCGVALNPLAVEGQLEGSIHMGLGQALMERIEHTEGAVQNASFLNYKIPSAFEMPEIELIYDGEAEVEGPFGAKEVGEGALAPFIPSIANAVYDAVGVRVRQLPMSADVILSALREKEGKK